MKTPQQLLGAIGELPLAGPVSVLHLSGDQERVIGLSGLRRALPSNVRLVAGPGCAASICPHADLYQAVQLAKRQPVTLVAAENMLHLPLGRHLPGPHTLFEAELEGADVRPVSAPIEAVLMAREEPRRQMVLFLAGFETLLAPLAGMILEGLPDNLSVLVCGRRVEPMLEELLTQRVGRGFDALLLPGNRCAVTGTHVWERIVEAHHLPAAVTGYTVVSILTGIHNVLDQHCRGEARLENLYRTLVRPEGNAMSRDQLDRVFELGEGRWRGLGSLRASAFRLRHAYEVIDADRRYPDYRGELPPEAIDLPIGCECAAVLKGLKDPTDCPLFESGCKVSSPYGPCMASEDGTCHLRSADRHAA